MIEYKMKRITEKLAGVDLKIECLENLDQTIDMLFTELDKTGNGKLLEELCPYFGVIWPSARALSEHLAHLGPTQFKDHAVLEIGCGLAIPSLAVAKLGAQVTATDFHPEVPRFLKANLALNGLEQNIRYVELDWQKDSSALERYDWIIGSDILYEKQHPAIVAKTIGEHLSRRGRAFVADPARPYLQNFADEMTARGFRQQTHVRKTPGEPGTKEIFILEFWR